MIASTQNWEKIEALARTDAHAVEGQQAAIDRAAAYVEAGAIEGLFSQTFVEKLYAGGAPMLEICESIAAGTPSLEIHPLSIGGKDDPARLVFSAPPGPAINASVLDLGLPDSHI